jgi:hypothetical protein
MKKLFTIVVAAFVVTGIVSPSFGDGKDKEKQWEKQNNKEQKYNRKSLNSPKSKLNILIDALVVCPPTSPVRFVDNGDGTICDHKTGLMWEMKLAADGTDGGNCADPAQDARDIHCANNLYLWKDPSDGNNANPDGTAFTVFLAELNQDTSDDSESICFANYCDWRIPRLAELRTIVATPCNGVPCLDPEFGPAMAAVYWSGTSYSTGPASAWVINFNTGLVDLGGKNTGGYVRAVRGAR